MHALTSQDCALVHAHMSLRAGRHLTFYNMAVPGPNTFSYSLLNWLVAACTQRTPLTACNASMRTMSVRCSLRCFCILLR